MPYIYTLIESHLSHCRRQKGHCGEGARLEDRKSLNAYLDSFQCSLSFCKCLHWLKNVLMFLYANSNTMSVQCRSTRVWNVNYKHQNIFQPIQTVTKRYRNSGKFSPDEKRCEHYKDKKLIPHHSCQMHFTHSNHRVAG